MGCARRSALETQRPAPRRARSIPPRREHTDPIYIMFTWDAIRSIIVINKRVRRELTCRSPLVCGKDLSLNGGSRSCHVTPDAMGAEMRATMGAAMGAQPSTIRAAISDTYGAQNSRVHCESRRRCSACKRPPRRSELEGALRADGAALQGHLRLLIERRVERHLERG